MSLVKRSTEEVFEDHLWHRSEEGVEPDLHNYAEDVVILSSYGVYHGHDGVRESGRLLQEHLPDGTFHFQTKLTNGDVAFLEWRGESASTRIEDGVDSFLIRDGLIQVQTIHYRIISPE